MIIELELFNNELFHNNKKGVIARDYSKSFYGKTSDSFRKIAENFLNNPVAISFHGAQFLSGLTCET